MSGDPLSSNPPEVSPKEEQCIDRSLLPEFFADADISEQMIMVLGYAALESLASRQLWSSLDVATRVDYERGRTSETQNPPRDFAIDILVALGYIRFVEPEDPKGEEMVQLTRLGKQKFQSVVEKPKYEDKR